MEYHPLVSTILDESSADDLRERLDWASFLDPGNSDLDCWRDTVSQLNGDRLLSVSLGGIVLAKCAPACLLDVPLWRVCSRRHNGGAGGNSDSPIPDDQGCEREAYPCLVLDLLSGRCYCGSDTDGESRKRNDRATPDTS